MQGLNLDPPVWNFATQPLREDIYRKSSRYLMGLLDFSMDELVSYISVIDRLIAATGITSSKDKVKNML